MNVLPFELLLTTLLVFSRVGAAIMLLPGFGSPRVPATVRLFLAIALSVALAPAISLQPAPEIFSYNVLLASLVGKEMAVGLALGLSGSLFVHATRFAGDVISNSIGLGGIPGQPIEGNDPLGQIASLLTLAVSYSMFAMDLHLQAIGALVSTYQIVGLGKGIESAAALDFATNTMRDAFLLALQIATPFIAFSLLSNLIVGLIGRMSPKVSIYFSVTGIFAIFGLWLLYLAAPSLLNSVPTSYSNWLNDLTS